MQNNIKIAVLEDNPLVSEVIADTLSSEGWQYKLCANILEIKKLLKDTDFDLYILDWMLPDGEASQVIQIIREQMGSNKPILIQSIHEEEERIVEALRLGADDYVLKPIKTQEFKARIYSLLRRSHLYNNNIPVDNYGHISIDKGEQKIAINGQEIALTAKEYELICYLFNRPNNLISREKLLNDIWGGNSGELYTRTVDIHISKVRNKLHLDDQNDIHIKTLRGFGYRLCLPEMN